MQAMRVRSALLAATAGLLAGGVALGAAELIAGLVPGAPSPVTEIGALLDFRVFSVGVNLLITSP